MCRNGTHKISEYEESNCIPLFILWQGTTHRKRLHSTFVAKHQITLLLAIPVNGISIRTNSRPLQGKGCTL